MQVNITAMGENGTGQNAFSAWTPAWGRGWSTRSSPGHHQEEGVWNKVVWGTVLEGLWAWSAKSQDVGKEVCGNWAHQVHCSPLQGHCDAPGSAEVYRPSSEVFFCPLGKKIACFAVWAHFWQFSVLPYIDELDSDEETSSNDNIDSENKKGLREWINRLGYTNQDAAKAAAMCRNGGSCKFLKINRCKFFHPKKRQTRNEG